MLKIYYGDLESDNYIFNPDVFFNNSYEDEWITDSFSVEMIKDIDKSDVIGQSFDLRQLSRGILKSATIVAKR